MGGIKKENEGKVTVKKAAASKATEKKSATSKAAPKASTATKTTAVKKAATEKSASSAATKASATKKTVATAEKKPAVKSATTTKTTATKTTEKATAAKAKKPVAGIDEEGTFRAWDNAKTVAKSKKEAAPKNSVEERAADKKATAEAEAKLAAAKKADPNAGIAKKEVSASDYSDDKIRHLDALEHIRLRSGMYIGRLGDGSNQNDGIYILLKEIIDNSIDEFIMGFGSKIDVEIKENRVKVRDYGRGIPLGKVVDCVSQINTGGKYNDDVFQFSVGMNGVGTKAVNAISSYFRVISIRDG